MVIGHPCSPPPPVSSLKIAGQAHLDGPNVGGFRRSYRYRWIDTSVVRHRSEAAVNSQVRPTLTGHLVGSSRRSPATVGSTLL